jgi:hypothetical protein
MITVAGVSVCKGKVKVRFCSDAVLRIKNLHKQGDTDIQLSELPKPMTKQEACNFLLESGSYEQYKDEILAVLGKKHLPSSSKQTIMKPVVEKDQELQAIQELAEA